MPFTTYTFIFGIAFFGLMAQWQSKSSKNPLFFGVISALIPCLFTLTLQGIVQLVTQQPLYEIFTFHVAIVFLVQLILSCLAFTWFDRTEDDYIIWGLALALSAATIFIIVPLLFPL